MGIVELLCPDGLPESFIQPEVLNPLDFETTTESYSLVDISGSYMLNMANNNLNLFWSVSNLFDKEYVDHLSRLKNLNLHAMGRNISVGLKYSF